MMEFPARLLVDSQDPELAYSILRAGLSFAGLEIRLQDSWLKNNEPLPADCAQRIALAWQVGRPVQKGVQFVTHDPAVMAELNQMDLFVDQEDFGPIEHGKSAIAGELEIEGYVGFVPITGEGS